MARKAGDADIIREARERFRRCVEWEAKARANALADAKFAAGDSYNLNQWDAAVRSARGDRPCLTNNLVRQHNLLIVNDARQNKAAVKVTPTGGRATYEAAEVFSGIIRRIEYQSKALDAYSTAVHHQVESGIGYVRVVTDFADEESFDQEIFIRRVANPRTIYLDPDCQQFDKSDMRFAFCFNDIARDAYEAEHGAGDMPPAAPSFDYNEGWNDQDHVRECEYWRRNDKTETLHLLADGTTVREADLPPGALEKLQAHIVKSRDVAQPEVEWFKLVGDRVEERKTWAGKYIPIVPWIGEEIVCEGVMDRKGHTRAMLDAQRIDNYWSSAAVEYVALQGKSPFVTDARAVEGYTAYWDSANSKNHSYLPYNGVDDSGQPIPPPQRSQPPVMPQAYIEGMRMARDDLMQVSGQHQSDLGMPGNERSGKAIDARQRQSEMSVAHYTDNQAKGIRQIGRILLDLIPKIYDTARVIKVLGEDGEDSDVALVPQAPNAHQHVVMGPNGPQPATPEEADAANKDPNRPDAKLIFSPRVGRYDVEADIGPSYGTQRMEAANAFSQIMAQNPSAFAIVGDFWAQNSDFPGADELAERLRRGLPSQYAGGPPPEVAQMQQHIEEVSKQGQQIAARADAEVSHLKAQLVQAQEQAKEKGNEIDIKNYEAETRRMATIGAVDPTALKVLIRSMLSEMLQMPALPVMHEHEAADAQHQQDIMPPDPDAQAPQPQPNGAGP